MLEVKKLASGAIVLRDSETGQINKEFTRYLKFLSESLGDRPSTVENVAYGLAIYYRYLENLQISVGDVLTMGYVDQFRHCRDFLIFSKSGTSTNSPRNNLLYTSANIYLKRVFGFLKFCLADGYPGQLRILEARKCSFINSYGGTSTVVTERFRGFLKADEEDEIKPKRDLDRESVEACIDSSISLRDKLLVACLAETGARISELLGVWYTEDIDYPNKGLRIKFRKDNDNGASAKNRENRTVFLSEETFEALTIYISRYADLLARTPFLFVTLSGPNAGSPLCRNTANAIVRRVRARSGVDYSYHSFRSFFANERRRDGWDDSMTSAAVGHRHIETTQEYYYTVRESEIRDALNRVQEQYQAFLPVEEVILTDK